MNTISTGQYTIIDMNDITINETKPPTPSKGDLWMDSSVNPPILKMFNGYSWVIVNDYSGNIKDLEDQINNTNNDLTNKIKEVKEVQESDNVDIQKLKDRVIKTITHDDLTKTTKSINDKILSITNETNNNKHLIEESAKNTKDEIIGINRKIQNIRDTNDSAKVAEKIEELTTKSNTLEKTLDGTKETISSIKQITDNNSKEIKDNTTTIEKTNREVNVKITDMDSKVNNANNKIVNLQANLDGVGAEIRQVGNATKGLSDKIAGIKITTDKISSKVDNTDNNVAKLSKDVQSSNSKVEQLSNKITNTVSQETLTTQLEQTNRQFRYSFQDTTYYNILRNSSPQNTLKCWRIYTSYGEPTSSIQMVYQPCTVQGKEVTRGIKWCGKNNGKTILINDSLAIDKYQFDTHSKYTLSGELYGQYGCGTIRLKICEDDGSNCILDEVVHIGFMEWQKINVTFKPNSTSANLKLFIYNEDNSSSFYLTINYLMLNKGDVALPWSLSCLELNAGNTVVDRDGIEIYNGGLKVVNKFGDNTIYIDDEGLVASDKGYGAYGTSWATKQKSGIHYSCMGIWQCEDDQPIYLHTNKQVILYRKDKDKKADLWAGETAVDSLWSNGNVRGDKISCNELWVNGSKHRLVETEHYGKLGMNAIESANCLFIDDGRAKTINKKCRVPLSNIYLETIENDYDVMLTSYGKSIVSVLDRKEKYFDVEVLLGEDTEFYYQVVAKQKGYAKERLQKFEEGSDN